MAASWSWAVVEWNPRTALVTVRILSIVNVNVRNVENVEGNITLEHEQIGEKGKNGRARIGACGLADFIVG